MSKKSLRQSQFSHVYSRSSFSPWEDASNLLLLADIQSQQGDKLELGYEHVIYLHRSKSGESLGVSISKQLLKENPEFESRYLEGVEMYCFLLTYIDEIRNFCRFHQNEFLAMFLLPVDTFFEAAEQAWLKQIEEDEV